MWDAIVVGAGPNGLAAAITLADAGRSVLLLERAPTVGGGVRSDTLTLPGFTHDVCSSVYPFVTTSAFFRQAQLERYGLALIQPPAPLAHPYDDGSAVVLERSVGATARGLDDDAEAYRSLMEPLVEQAGVLTETVLAPPRLPAHPLVVGRFAAMAFRSARALGGRFRGARARGLIAGLAAHSLLPLERRPSAAFALVLAVLGHAAGWPIVRGGAQRLADAMADHLRALGGEIRTGYPVYTVDELPQARVVLLDVTPRQALALAGHGLSARYRRTLGNYRYGPGVFKVDWALAAPIPWRAPECGRTATVHVGGTFEEIAAAEAAVARGEHPARPFVLVTQPSLFDSERAPTGRHTAWGYCHVPNGSGLDMTERIEDQIERFAPGFRGAILARHVIGPARLESHNPNCVGGDIGGGVQDLRQILARPVLRIKPWATPVPGLFLCSASTPPGGGVHGMCGFWAARAASRQAAPDRPPFRLPAFGPSGLGPSDSRNSRSASSQSSNSRPPSPPRST